MKESMAVIRVGKSGVTDSLIAEIRGQLRRKRILKVRVLRSLGTTDRRVFAREVAGRAGAVLVDVRGNTFTLTLKK